MEKIVTGYDQFITGVAYPYIGPGVVLSLLLPVVAGRALFGKKGWKIGIAATALLHLYPRPNPLGGT